MTVTNEQAEITVLQMRLEEAEETIRAIRSGAVDAFVIEVPNGARVYTLETADRPYRLLVEEMQQGALTLSDNGTITYCNRRFANLVGRPHEQLTGIAFGNFVPFDAQTLYESLLLLGRAGCSQGESHVQNADGTLVPVFLTLNALPPDCGASVGLLVTDLTTHRHHEKMNALLEALKEADHRKNEFLAMLAHELRSPLAPIANAVELLGLQEATENLIQQQARGIIERQMGQLQHLVNDLLEVSRITTGRVQLRRERLVVSDIVRGAVETVRPLMEELRHELTMSLPPGPIWLHADATRLEQVLVNLLTNAAKYTDEGGHIWLEVSVEGRGTCENSGELREASVEKESAAGFSLTTDHPPLTTPEDNDDRATLSGTQGVASGNELVRTVLPGDEELSQGRAVRLNQPDSPSGSIDAGQHRRGTGPTAHQRIPKLSEHRTGIAHGGGNALTAQSTGGLAPSTDTGRASDNVGRNQSDALGASAGARSEALKLTTHHSPLATPCCVIRVRDTGVGISPALLPHIFDLFTQGERSLDRSQGGLGIGLALVHRLTELHGGTVAASSVLGHGSEFVVRLPLGSDEWRVASGEQENLGHAPLASSSPLATPVLVPSASHSSLTTPLRVLVVDDNEDTVFSLSMLLRASGHDVRIAHDGLAAVQAAIDYRPDVVLLDIGLPGLTGYEVAKRIRQHPDLKHVMLIALTGYGQDSDRETSLEAGFNHHLVKPARFEQLQQILATVPVSGMSLATGGIAPKQTQEPPADAVPLITPTTTEVLP